MLVELSIRNFAIISSITVGFREGLHVLTGETGAGKSIILDAVSMLIGGRASADYVRYGTAKAEIEGLFELPDNHPVTQLLEELGIELEEDRMLILRRDISVQGKSVCRVNGKLVTLAVLREIGRAIVDLHSQYEHHHLLHEEKYISLLDAYGKKELAQHKQEVYSLYQKYKTMTNQIQKLNENEQQVAQRLDLLKYQLQEIVAAELEPEEDIQLQKDKQKLTHSQKLFKGVSEAYRALQADGGTIDSLGLVMSNLQELSHYDEQLHQWSKVVEDAYYQLEEVILQLGRYQDDFEFHPDHLTQIENRLMEIDNLKRKYGSTVSDILEYAAQIEDELDSLEHKEERMDELVQRQQRIGLDLALEAQHLSTLRSRVTKELENEIQRELQGLHMDHTKIHIDILPASSGEAIDHEGVKRFIRQDGWDEVQIMISPNPGEPPKPLSKIASGGELSRLMLALKTVLAKNDHVTTLIFDEVDTGVSGRVAQSMAEKLYKISLSQQVLCISHHAQVAAMADEHYRIEKHQTEQETKTLVVSLNHEERAEELARMMSGAEVTDVTLQHASELLRTASVIQGEWQGKKEKVNVN